MQVLMHSAASLEIAISFMRFDLFYPTGDIYTVNFQLIKAKVSKVACIILSPSTIEAMSI